MKTFYLSPANISQPLFRDDFNIFKRKPIILLDRSIRWRKVAELAGLSDKAKLKLEWIIFYYSLGNKNAFATARHFNISPKTFYKWLNRFVESRERVETLEERSRRPRQVRQWQVSALEQSRIINLRKQYLRWGKRKLKALYQKQFQESISSWKIQRVINRFNLYPEPAKKDKAILKRKRNKLNPKKRIPELKKQNIPWFLFNLDGITIYSNHLKRYIMTAVDYAGKFGFARMYSHKSATSAQDFLLRLKFAVNQPIVNIQTDNGSEFAGVFNHALDEQNITHYFSRPYTPKDNAEVERFNQTLKYEWLQDANFTTDCQRFNESLTDWLIAYNFIRPHETLDYLTPMEYIEKYQNRLAKKQTKLLPMCPAWTID